MKTIVIVSDTIYPYFKGGKEKRIHEITTRLARMGYDVHIYTMTWWDGPSAIIEEGVHLHGISKLHTVYKSEGRRSIKAGIYFALRCFKLLNVDFDVIDVDHMPYLPMFSIWVVCKLKRKPMYATWHEVWTRKYWHEYMGAPGIIGYFIERLGAHLPDHIIVDSVHTRDKLVKRHPSKESRIVMAYNGVDLEEIESIEPAKKSYDVMFAGRLIGHKNVKTLIKAINELKIDMPTITCAIIGSGPDKKNLVARAKRLGLMNNIDFISFVPDHADLYALMKSSKVFVLPSTREGFGIVVIEANACGTPVITLNHPHNAARDLIQEGVNGYLFNDYNDLADKIKLALKDPNTNPYQYREAVEQYDWQSTTKSILEAYAS